MSTHVLLSILKELGKITNARLEQAFFSLFRNEFYKINNIGA